MFRQRAHWACGLTWAFAIFVVEPAAAQTLAEAEKLNSEVIRLYRAGKYAEAVPIAQQLLGLREKMLGPEHPDVAQALNNLALLFKSRGRYAEAEQFYNRTVSTLEKMFGANHPDVCIALNNLAVLYEEIGRYGEAEPILKRVLALRENALGPDHVDVAGSLNNLAELYHSTGRIDEAEPLFTRSLAVREKAFGPDHMDVGTSLNSLAALYEAQGRYGEAEPLLRRELAITEKLFGSDHPNIGTSLNNLAALHEAQSRYGEAEFLYRRSLSVYERAFGLEHPLVATSLNNLAVAYDIQGRHSDAEPLYKRSLAIRERILGLDHPDVGTSLNNLAALALAQGDFARAADYWQRATSVLRSRASRVLGGASVATFKAEAQRKSWYFSALVKTTYRLSLRGRGDEHKLAAEMFETGQWALDSSAAVSLAQMAARSAGGSPELARIIRERQDLVADWLTNDKLLISAKSELPDKRNATAEKALADQLAAIDARLSTIDSAIAREFPKYAALANPKSIAVADVQALLRDDEALVLFLDTDARFKPLPEETFVWVVTKTGVRWVSSELGTAAMVREVSALRCGLDAAAWSQERSPCFQLTGASFTDADQQLPFDTVRAHALYRGLFGDIEDLVRGKHLLIVPSGSLTTLPFQVLVKNASDGPSMSSARWLIRDHAITVLPSVASLAALRLTGKPSAASKPMIGFGNPLLEGDQDHPELGAFYKRQAQLAREHSVCANAAGERTAALRRINRSLNPMRPTTRLADVAQLRIQTPLPETADELCEVARAVGGQIEDIRIGARATETELKRLSSAGELAKYRMLHFATHGALAGQLSGTREPGLILTPPPMATAEDDGYLSGSEVAALKLDADWVILSACDTAGGASEGEASEALSGLARVFFYAGARALVVSHWSVDSAATVKLITAAANEITRDKSIGRAEALRRATLALMDDTTRPAHWVPAWHPSVWAPFVVVGEGGVGR
jgi:CHAT domain-containing protein/Flp pilus assembly protein TadD